MENKHTPGIWEVFKRKENELIVLSEHDNFTRTEIVCHVSADPGIEAMTANAKLIAASPNMLKALIKIKDYVTRERSAIHGLPQDYILKDVNEAIKKATI